MSKLVDIKGFWDMSYGYDFNDNDMWEGKIQLQLITMEVLLAAM